MARSQLSRFIPALAGVGLLSLGAIGCASKEDLTAIQMDRNNLAEQLSQAQREAEGNRKMVESLRAQLASAGTGQEAERAQMDNFRMQIAQLTAERDELMNKYSAMMEKIGTGPALPPDLDNELEEFARLNPTLIDYDSKAGIVKFKSDVTFASGDAELTPEARSVVTKFAAILNGPVAQNYELRIAGHTDNVPVSNQLTVSKGHKDNWFLSSHRAISVASALRQQNVAASRIGVTGFADQRPVASNDSPSGRQQNRRVEVLILPTQATPAPATPTAAAPTTPDADMAAASEDGVSK